MAVNATDLLKWAVDFVELETQLLEESYSGPGGVIDDDEVSDELRDARRWLSEAHEWLGSVPAKCAESTKQGDI